MNEREFLNSVNLTSLDYFFYVSYIIYLNIFDIGTTALMNGTIYL